MSYLTTSACNLLQLEICDLVPANLPIFFPSSNWCYLDVSYKSPFLTHLKSFVLLVICSSMNEMFETLVIKELSLQKKYHYLTLHKAHVKLPLTFSHLRLLISECNCKNESFAPTSSFVNHTVKIRQTNIINKPSSAWSWLRLHPVTEQISSFPQHARMGIFF